MDYEVVGTSIERISPDYLDRLRFTGASAVEHITAKRDIRQQEGLMAYLDVPSKNEGCLDELLRNEGWDLPEGDQELYLLHSDYTPSAFPYDRVNLVDPDVMVEDYRRSNPRRFSQELEEDSYFRRFIDNSLSSLKKEELSQYYDDTEMPWS